MELSFDDRRVLGALVEKSMTTPDQYPLTLNALVNACNQKSCRNPMTQFGEERVLDCIDSMRPRGLVTVIQTAGGRTDRYKHNIRDALEIDGPQAAVLGELLLRGPQTDGELRQNAKRMAKSIDSLDALREILDALAGREPALLTRLSPGEQRRGVRYAHTLYAPEELEKLRQEESEQAIASVSSAPASRAPAPSPTEFDEIRTELGALRELVESIDERLRRLEGI